MKLLAIAMAVGAMAVAQTDPATWISYGKDSFGWRYSELTEINTRTVTRLAPAWMYQTGVPGKNETTPLVFGDMMNITGPSNNAWALDALTGRPIWSYRKALPANVSLCCGQVNRGFAVHGHTLFKVDLQGTLVALDAKSGTVLWESTLED